jgi:hypothetical protein
MKAVVPPAPPAPTIAERKAAPPPAVLGNAVASYADHGNHSFEDDDDPLGGGPSLDLDLGNGPPLVTPVAGAAPAAPAGPRNSATRVPVAGAAAPAKRAAEAKPGDVSRADGKAAPANGVDPYEARALADYGDPPAQWWKTPLYAFRVLRRRPELKKLAEAKKREAERAEGAAEDALLVFAEQIRPTAEKLGAYARAFQDVRDAEQVQRERDAVLAQETDAHRQKQAEVDARISELEAQLTQIQMEERTIAGELNEAETLLKRADARVKRVEIEIRNALQQAGVEQPGEAKAP